MVGRINAILVQNSAQMGSGLHRFKQSRRPSGPRRLFEPSNNLLCCICTEIGYRKDKVRADVWYDVAKCLLFVGADLSGIMMTRL